MCGVSVSVTVCVFGDGWIGGGGRVNIAAVIEGFQDAGRCFLCTSGAISWL